MSARFGTAGNSAAFLREVSKATVDAPAWLRRIGLDAYEYQCGRGVRLRRETAERIGRAAAENGIVLSLHAPYFINPANPAPESRKKNRGYVLAACEAARWLGARRIVIHTGTLMKRSREAALATARESFADLLAACGEAGYGDLTLCPETMGRIGQLGTLEEVLAICAPEERLLPCVDFGHLYARTAGALDGAEAMGRMLDSMENALGAARASVFHAHFSHIEYTVTGGEVRHLSFAESGGYGPDFEPLAEELARRGWSPTIICESAGTQSEDALEMKRMYAAAVRNRGAERGAARPRRAE